VGVGEWFSEFCTGLRIDSGQRSSISYRTGRIARQLNVDFRNLDSDVANRFYVGSYGRGTAIPSVSDVDVLYVLPAGLYAQYDAHAGNGQSALLSAVRASLQNTYSSSSISGNGQVVGIEFTDGIKFEVLPAFVNTADGYTFADANGGGSWRACRPKQEMDAFANRDIVCGSNLIELSRMARAWRDANNVPLNGMLIDTLGYQFIETWSYRDKGYFYYDYLTRDFFHYLANQDPSKSYWQAPGSGSYVYRTGSFEYKARQAELRSLEAIAYQANGNEWSAKQKYREIYGTTYPS
jgi:Second Messenger Oligonucleotide or Dinucleotide Synthetase domain